MERRHIVFRSTEAWHLSEMTEERLADCEDGKQLSLFNS
jgi:hypothetical protein